MSLIDIKDLTFTHIGSLKPIFDHVSLQLDTNWKLGFIGRNGYGKSTFLNLLMDNFPYKGSINTSVDFEYFPYVVKNPEDMTIEVIETLKGEFPLWKLQREMNLLELKEDILYRPFSTLSHGEQTKILLATMFITDNQFLLIDEPTNHLDIHGRKSVAEYLAKKKGFIVISHDREFLNISIDHILAIEKNKIVLTKGNYDTWQHNKHLEDKFELAQNEKLRKEIRRLKETAREKAIWSDKTENTKIGQGPVDRGYIGHKSAKMMKRSKSIERRYEATIQKKQELLKNIESIDPLQIASLEHNANTFIEAKDFTIYYNDIPVFKPIDFTVDQGECLVLEGNNGSGKSSIIKAILGEKLQTNGKLWKTGYLTISYVPQHFDFLKGNLFEYINGQNIDKTQFLAIFRKMGIDREQFDIPMELYSSGQKKKVLLAKSLCEHAHVYIWDEPLNYIDIISRIQIENMILEFCPTMILVEHDKNFIDKVATDIIELQ